MKDLKDFIGDESKTEVESFSTELVRDFARAVSGPYQATGTSTIWTRLRAGEFELLDRMGLELKQLLHGEQEYEFFQTPRAEFSYRYSTQISGILEKLSGETKLHLITFETRIVGEQDSALSAIARSTIVYRERRAVV